MPEAWSPDGARLLYDAIGTDSMAVLWTLALKDKKAERFGAVVSKNEDGRHHPVWSPDGKELFFTPGPGSRLHVVSISTQPAFSFGEAVVLPRPFANTGPEVERPYDVSRDGQRFLGVIDAAQSAPSGATQAPQIQVVLNWFEELKRRVPTR